MLIFHAEGRTRAEANAEAMHFLREHDFLRAWYAFYMAAHLLRGRDILQLWHAYQQDMEYGVMERMTNLARIIVEEHEDWNKVEWKFARMVWRRITECAGEESPVCLPSHRFYRAEVTREAPISPAQDPVTTLAILQLVQAQDVHHPIHWPAGKRWGIIFVYCSLQMFVTLTSTTYFLCHRQWTIQIQCIRADICCVYRIQLDGINQYSMEYFVHLSLRPIQKETSANTEPTDI